MRPLRKRGGPAAPREVWRGNNGLVSACLIPACLTSISYFGTFDLGPGARMGRPCYLVISVTGNRVTAVTVDCDFLMYGAWNIARQVRTKACVELRRGHIRRFQNLH